MLSMWHDHSISRDRYSTINKNIFLLLHYFDYILKSVMHVYFRLKKLKVKNWRGIIDFWIWATPLPSAPVCIGKSSWTVWTSTFLWRNRARDCRRDKRVQHTRKTFQSEKCACIACFVCTFGCFTSLLIKNQESWQFKIPRRLEFSCHFTDCGP